MFYIKQIRSMERDIKQIRSDIKQIRSMERDTQRLKAINALTGFIIEHRRRLLRSGRNLIDAELELNKTRIERIEREGWTLQWVQSESNTQPSRSTYVSDQQASQ